MWSDNETTLDLLDFSDLVAAVLSVIQNNRLLPATVGIFGDWGSGKSSLMRMVQAQLEKGKRKETTLCVSFNGWLFEGYAGARTALMEAILHEISEKRTLSSKAEDAMKRLVKRVDMMRLAWMASKYTLGYALAGDVGLGIAALTDLRELGPRLAEKLDSVADEDLKQLLKDSAENSLDLGASIRDFRKDFSELLGKTDIETLVVFIDDLDRCTPNTIIATLEAIKLFLFTPQTVFLIGADERLVKSAVRRRFPELPGDTADVGRDYLEKLVQFPVRIPSLGRVELETYIKLLFVQREGVNGAQLEQIRAAAVNRAPDQLYDVTFRVDTVEDALGEVSTELREGIALAEYLAPVLTSGLAGNPRQTKRFLNTLMMRNAMADARRVDLHLRVLAKIMLLEYFRPEAFRELARIQTEQHGRPAELTDMEEQVRRGVQDDGASQRVSARTTDARHRPPGARNGRKAGRSPGQPRSSRGSGARAFPELGSAEAVEDIVATWLSDSWIRAWLLSDPPLGSHDLRPYFFFSRDKLGPIEGAGLRLSPAAQQVLGKMLSESDLLRRQGAEEAARLNEAEATSVFSALAHRARQHEDLRDHKSPLFSMFQLIEVRPELQGQLVSVVGQLADSALPPAAVPALVRLTRGSEAHTATLGLLKRWSESTVNRPLAEAAKGRLSQERSDQGGGA